MDAAQIDERIKSYSLTQEQIRFHFKNKFVGLSAEFNSEQLNRLTKDFSEDELQTIPGEFIITFIDPFDGKKWVTEEGAKWSWKTIKKCKKNTALITIKS